ncbi:MAG: HlyC/CorC family transporter [Bacteroidetes bacterium]|nr:HlyC/CorC family transporter [Bacteroidota bacterium]
MSAFFSGMEIAFISANKLQVELDNQKGSWAGRQVAGFIKRPERFISTILVGNNISLVIFGLMSAKLLEPGLFRAFGADWAVLLVQTLITTLIVLLFGEFFPKALFRVFANPILKLFIVPFFILYVILFIAAKLFEYISKGILKIFGVNTEETSDSFTPVDLEYFVKEHSTSEEQDRDIDTDLFENALYFRDTKVRECMIPRTEIAAVDENTNLQELRSVITKTNYSRILIFRENIDNIIGYVHHFDLLLKTGTLRQILMPIKAVTETMPAPQLLNELIKEAKSIAYVVDEYGGTAGIVTLEDILEEIFGEIQDEHDKDTNMARQIAPNEYMLSGRLEVDLLNDEFDLDIPEGEYETISGFILAYHENIPALHDIISIDDFTFTILEVTERKIETLKLVVHKDLDDD